MPSNVDPRWPKVLSLSVHEFRTPLTVVAGYIRMLLKDRAGPLSDQQRRLLEEAEKSCGRLSALLAEVSELSTLEGGTMAFQKQETDLRALIRSAVEQLPPLPDREVAVALDLREGPALLQADPVRLGRAISALIAALRRELVQSDPLVIRERPADPGVFELLIGEPPTIEALEASPERPVFDEWRGGVGLSLAVARRIIEAHGGRLEGAPEGHKTGARLTLTLQ